MMRGLLSICLASNLCFRGYTVLLWLPFLGSGVMVCVILQSIHRLMDVVKKHEFLLHLVRIHISESCVWQCPGVVDCKVNMYALTCSSVISMNRRRLKQDNSWYLSKFTRLGWKMPDIFCSWMFLVAHDLLLLLCFSTCHRFYASLIVKMNGDEVDIVGGNCILKTIRLSISATSMAI